MHPLLNPPTSLRRLQIETTTWCNLKCVGCPRTIDTNKGVWENRHMPVAMFRRIIDHMPPAYVAVLQGIGEPTLHPDILELVTIARGSGKFQGVSFNTNALAHGIDFYRKLIHAGLNHLSISVDSFNQDIAERCRSGTLTRKLRERVVELRREFPLNYTISIVLSRLNLYDFPNTLAELNGIGKFMVEIQPMMIYAGQPPEPGQEDKYLGPDEVTLFNRMRDLITPTLPNLEIITAGPLWHEGRMVRCTRPFTSPYVTVDGYLTPCCTILSPDVYGQTSVHDMTFEDAWRSPGVSDWIKSYIEKQPDICIGCTFNPM